MRSPKRFLAAVTVAVSLAAVLTSCVPAGFFPTRAPAASEPATSEPATEAGISREAAAELLNAVPGLRSGDVGSVISGLSYEVVMEVSLDDPAVITAPGVLDYVLRVGWATAATNEPAMISLTVWNNGTRLDLQDEANALAGVDHEAYPELYSVHLNPADFLGSWPGAVPTPPVG